MGSRISVSGRMMDKTKSIVEIVAEIESGMTIGIGGWGARRKPMAFVRELLQSPVTDLTLLSYGGPDVGMLTAAGKIKKLVFGFVSMDTLPLEPHFRAARQAGSFEVMEIDEGMFQLGLKAAAARLPFLPTRVGIGSDVLTKNPHIRMIRSPYSNEELVAVPALPVDLAVCHVNQADNWGNSRISGPDPFFDEWFCRAADRAFLTTEEIVPTHAFNDPMIALQMPIERNLVQGVALAAHGAHPTSCGPRYGIDVEHLRRYSAAAKGGWSDYFSEFVEAKSLADYLELVGGTDRIDSLPLPVF